MAEMTLMDLARECRMLIWRHAVCEELELEVELCPDLLWCRDEPHRDQVPRPRRMTAEALLLLNKHLHNEVEEAIPQPTLTVKHGNTSCLSSWLSKAEVQRYIAQYSSVDMHTWIEITSIPSDVRALRARIDRETAEDVQRRPILSYSSSPS